MKNYKENDVRRAIRNLSSAIDDVISSDAKSYKYKIQALIHLTETDPIVKAIVEPFKQINIILEEVHYSEGGWIDEIRLPIDVDKKIAYILKVFNEVAFNQLELEMLAFRIYGHKNIVSNLNDYLNKIASPILRELIYKLEDVLSDNVEGQEIIPEAAIQIINHGTIHAEHGSNIALGKDIQQTSSYYTNNLAKDILEKVLEEGILPGERIQEVEEIANELQRELQSKNPTPGKLKQLAGRVYTIGEQGLLKAFTTVVTDPRWGQVAAETLLNI